MRRDQNELSHADHIYCLLRVTCPPTQLPFLFSTICCRRAVLTVLVVTCWRSREGRRTLYACESMMVWAHLTWWAERSPVALLPASACSGTLSLRSELSAFSDGFRERVYCLDKWLRKEPAIHHPDSCWRLCFLPHCWPRLQALHGHENETCTCIVRPSSVLIRCYTLVLPFFLKRNSCGHEFICLYDYFQSISRLCLW